MPKEYDNFVELSLAEEELMSGGFVRRLFRSAGRVVKSAVRLPTRKKTWRTTFQVLETVGQTAGTLLGAVTTFLPKK